MRPPPSGEQYILRHGAQHATVVEVGGGVRTYGVGDRDVLHPYPVDAICDAAHGAPLIPWPNRLADGRYRFDGVEHQVALTEPDKTNAIHGLLRWRPWRAAEHDDTHVVMTTRLHPRPGYPFTLDVTISYGLDERGLTVRTAATNIGDTPCPYAGGQHPYLSPGHGRIDACTLQFGAGFRVDTDAERQLPAGDVPVAGTPYDFSEPRVIGALTVDHAFGDLQRDDDDLAWLLLTGADGRTARLWADRGYRYLEIYSADGLGAARERAALGVEPMTAPPNALASGTDLLRLQPGQTATQVWGADLA